MTPERYARLVDLFHAAATRTPSVREAFLSQACEGDEELRREIEDMLAVDERSVQFLDDSPDDIAAETVASSNEGSFIGQTLGQYHIIARLGSGGMGAVFLAHDKRLNRKRTVRAVLTY